MYVLMALVLLGILIILHEAGHFWAARLCGIEVQEFSVGMGPLLLQRKGKKETLYSLRTLPVGGFCRFYGEDEGEIVDPRAFDRAPLPRRMFTVFAGPGMNFIVAILAIIIYLSAVGIPVSVPVVGAVEENAALAGLQLGDSLIAVNGNETDDTSAISQLIASSEGETVILTVRRDSDEIEVSIVPFYDETLQRYRLGFSFAQARERISVLKSIPFSVRYNWESVVLIVRTLKNLIFRGEGVSDMTGPVGTVYVIQEATREGGIDIWLELLALISVNLGIMNLLPIPGLDGSRLLFQLLEIVRGKPVKRELEGTIHLVGIALLMGLMLVLTYKDIMQFFIHR